MAPTEYKAAALTRSGLWASAAAWLRPGARGPAAGAGPHPGRPGPCSAAGPDPLLCARLSPPAPCRGGAVGSFLRTPGPLLRRGPCPCAGSLRRGAPALVAPRFPRPPGSCARPLVRRCRGSAGTRWPRLPPAPPLLRCGLPVRSPFLRAGLGLVQRVAPPGPPAGPSVACLRRPGGCAAAPRASGARGSRPWACAGCARLFRPPAPGLFAARRAPAPGLLPPAGVPPAGVALGPRCLGFARGSGFAGAAFSAHPGALQGILPCLPPRPCRPLRGLAGSARLRLGASRPRAFGAPPLAAAASVLSKNLDNSALTFPGVCDTLFLRGCAAPFWGRPLGVRGVAKRLCRKTGPFLFALFFICCAATASAISQV